MERSTKRPKEGSGLLHPRQQANPEQAHGEPERRGVRGEEGQHIEAAAKHHEEARDQEVTERLRDGRGTPEALHEYPQRHPLNAAAQANINGRSTGEAPAVEGTGWREDADGEEGSRKPVGHGPGRADARSPRARRAGRPRARRSPP